MFFTAPAAGTYAFYDRGLSHYTGSADGSDSWVGGQRSEVRVIANLAPQLKPNGWAGEAAWDGEFPEPAVHDAPVMTETHVRINSGLQSGRGRFISGTVTVDSANNPGTYLANLWWVRRSSAPANDSTLWNSATFTSATQPARSPTFAWPAAAEAHGELLPPGSRLRGGLQRTTSGQFLRGGQTHEQRQDQGRGRDERERTHWRTAAPQDQGRSLARRGRIVCHWRIAGATRRPHPGAPGDPMTEGMVCTNGDTSVAGHRAFNLTASDGYTSEPDGNAIYDWGYGVAGKGFQLPGPVLCVIPG